MKREGELWRFSRLRQIKYLNNIVEQDHRRIKRLVRPGLGFGSLPTARRTLAGYEGMAMIRKGQVRNIGGCEMRAQAALAAGLFGVAARSGPCHAAFSAAPQLCNRSVRFLRLTHNIHCTNSFSPKGKFRAKRRTLLMGEIIIPDILAIIWVMVLMCFIFGSWPLLVIMRRVG